MKPNALVAVVVAFLLSLVVGHVIGSTAAHAQTRSADTERTLKALNGSPKYRGTLYSYSANGHVTTNATTDAGNFTINSGALVLVQCDATAYALPALTDGGVRSSVGAVSVVSVSETTGVKIRSTDNFYMLLRNDENGVGMDCASGTCICGIWEVE